MRVEAADAVGVGAVPANDALVQAEPITGGAEWRAYPMLPIAAAFGYATSVIHIYGFGPYVVPVSQAFGWSRAMATAGISLATIVQAFFGILIGLAVDRFGPRGFALLGIVLVPATFGLIGTATGSDLNWYLLWGLLSLCVLPVQATIWTSAVASRFTVSRGMAFAVTLCGASIAATVFPLMGSYLIGRLGWRLALAAQGGLWLLLAFPIIFVFFRSAFDREKGARKVAGEKPKPRDLPGATLREGVFSTIYARLFVACLLFTFTILALVVHFVPILTDRGADPVAAAGLASLIGVFSLVGRLTTGALLDRFPASLVGAVVFVLPVGSCLILLLAASSYFALGLAATLVGLTLGAEIDVVVYLLSRHFGLKNFGGLYGGLLAALSIGTAAGPLAASSVFDHTGSYALFLWGVLGCMAASSVAIASLPWKAREWSAPRV
ncbi:MFS transporter [Novosphingobium sp. 9U]|uniref:MFS transporter n=1 Tax=Novosphingobium sp. 9U TaxID=2653158 RepID=UPI0012F2F8D6|nr:MFS transporter [Novosphingobium sp. 9U]VWX46585.1 MFS transporter [Novosphingobium sp. 9U]